uniref:Uncharacterized protein n=1 Tax=Anguilla anguilla TaxID=7936 RepID=A0A0E9QWC4_ANGAN
MSPVWIQRVIDLFCSQSSRSQRAL